MNKPTEQKDVVFFVTDDAVKAGVVRDSFEDEVAGYWLILDVNGKEHLVQPDEVSKLDGDDEIYEALRDVLETVHEDLEKYAYAFAHTEEVGLERSSDLITMPKRSFEEMQEKVRGIRSACHTLMLKLKYR